VVNKNAMREKCQSITKQMLWCFLLRYLLIMKKFNCDDKMYISVKYISLIENNKIDWNKIDDLFAKIKLYLAILNKDLFMK